MISVIFLRLGVFVPCHHILPSYCVLPSAVIGQDPNESFYARIPGGQQSGLTLPKSSKDRPSSVLPSTSNVVLTNAYNNFCIKNVFVSCTKKCSIQALNDNLSSFSSLINFVISWNQ